MHKGPASHRVRRGRRVKYFFIRTGANRSDETAHPSDKVVHTLAAQKLILPAGFAGLPG